MGILGSGWNQVQVCLYKCVSKGNIQKPVYSFIGSPHVHSPKEPRVSQWRPWNLRNEERLRCFRNGWMPGKPNIIPKRSKIVGVKCYRNWSILGHKKSSETLRVLGVNLETQELLIFVLGGVLPEAPGMKIRHWKCKSLKLKLLICRYKRSNQLAKLHRNQSKVRSEQIVPHSQNLEKSGY